MIRATRVFPSGNWSHVATDTVVLDHDHRRRRRLAMQGEAGLDFLLDLPEPAPLRHGDGLLLDDGRVVAVHAAEEPLAEITAADAAHLVRLAWHIGNRHLPAELSGDRIYIAEDHVIEEMLAGLGATVSHVSRPFEPEGGAYAESSSGHAHGHDHHHHG